MDGRALGRALTAIDERARGGDNDEPGRLMAGAPAGSFTAVWSVGVTRPHRRRLDV